MYWITERRLFVCLCYKQAVKQSSAKMQPHLGNTIPHMGSVNIGIYFQPGEKSSCQTFLNIMQPDDSFHYNLSVYFHPRRIRIFPQKFSHSHWLQVWSAEIVIARLFLFPRIWKWNMTTDHYIKETINQCCLANIPVQLRPTWCGLDLHVQSASRGNVPAFPSFFYTHAHTYSHTLRIFCLWPCETQDMSPEWAQ